MAKARAFVEECGADVLTEISRAISFSFFQLSNKETDRKKLAKVLEVI